MFDTVAISGSFMYLPDVQLLIKNGCRFFTNKDGEAYKVVLNGNPGAKEPRLTITRSQKGFWRLQAEVSIGAWLFNSNLFLPNEYELNRFVSDLSDFIWYKIGIRFDAWIERTTVLDVTKDFNVGENRVIPIIKEFAKLSIKKYDRITFNDTSVYFENKGKVKNKILKIYSKYHERLENNAKPEEIELAKGLLRLEIHHGDNRAVANLAKSLHLPNHKPKYMLTRQTSEAVLERTLKLLNFDSILNYQFNSNLENLAMNFDSSMPLILAGHLAYKEKYGADYYELPFIKIKKETVKNYDRLCVKTGILSL